MSDRRSARAPTSAPPGRARGSRALVAGAALGLIALLGGSVPGAQAQADGGGDEIDVLTATREEVQREVAALDSRYAEQQRVVERAKQRVTEATDAAATARERVRQAREDVEEARLVVRDYAVEAYIRPPAEDALRVLSVSRADDAGYASSVIRILTERRHEVVGVLVAKQAVADREQAAAEAAAAEAESLANDAEIELVELDRTRAEQQDLAESLDARLDAALAEAAAIAAVDAQLAAELAADELALRESGPATPVEVASETSEQLVAAPATQPSARPVAEPGGNGGPTTPAPAPPATSPRPAAPRPTPTTRPPAPPTTSRPAPARPPGGVTWADVTNVGGIYVHRSIASNVRALLNAATAAGLNLRGGGYRDSASQVAVRRQNCGPTYYDIYQRPASQCRPPTAIPGRSMHERGLAIDFTSGGRLIRSRSDRAFVWLRANASRYGFYNLPSEPWHWSTTGS